MKTIFDLATPALVLDIEAFESNLVTMSRFVAERKVALRAHAKTHKCPEVARRQIQHGAIGICAATIAEAEVLSSAGIRGLLITAELVGEPKVSRFIEVLKRAPDTMLVVDDADNAAELQRAAQKAGVLANLLIDLDIGQNRTGIQPGEDARKLAAAIARHSNLRIRGICAYAGHLAHVVGFDERKRASSLAFQQALETRDLLIKDGHNIEILSGGSTGTYNIDSWIGGVTEIQAGSYAFMDVEYRGIGGSTGPVYSDFRNALFVLSTVIHRSEGKAVVDAGLKAFATDRPFGPIPAGRLDGVTYEFAGDEHGRLNLNVSSTIKLGDRIRFIPPHCDPTVNLYDRIHCVRGDEVVDTWPIMNRAGGYF